jgi:hypothetical protein
MWYWFRLWLTRLYMVSQSRHNVCYEKPLSVSRFHIGFMFHISFIDIWCEVILVSLMIHSFIDGFTKYRHRLVQQVVWCIEVSCFTIVWLRFGTRLYRALRIHSFIDGSTKDLVRDLVQSRHIVWHDKFSYLEDRGFTKVSCLTIVYPLFKKLAKITIYRELGGNR